MAGNATLKRKLKRVLALRAKVATAEQDLSNSLFRNNPLPTEETEIGVLPPRNGQARPYRAGTAPRDPV